LITPPPPLLFFDIILDAFSPLPPSITLPCRFLRHTDAAAESHYVADKPPPPLRAAAATLLPLIAAILMLSLERHAASYHADSASATPADVADIMLMPLTPALILLFHFMRHITIIAAYCRLLRCH